ncbi:MAG TPA: AarF/UbiB family protein, partial [Clostridia bacterium]
KKAKRIREIIRILKKNDIIHGITPEKLKSILEELGPTFIKMGQIMSMRPDILPPEYCNELKGLRSNVRPMDFNEVKKIIQTEYSASIEEIFENVEPMPLGSASIAQVHNAILKDGKKVVIKVQRLNIREIMGEDIAIMRKAIGLVKKISKAGDAIDFKTVLEEMWIAAQQEMDFLIESSHLEEFADLNSDISYVTCPKVEKSLTTSRILVMEHIDGLQIDDLEAIHDAGYDINEIGKKLALNYAKQVLDDAFFHADPHPGNIRVRDNKIVWLDLGMMGRLNNRDKQLLKSSVNAIVHNDINGLKSVLINLCSVRGKINHVALYSDIDDMLTRYIDLDLDSIDIGKVIMELNDLANRHHISMPGGIALLGRGILTIEGLMTSICPKINFVEILANHISGKIIEEFDISKEISKKFRSFANTLDKSIDIPSQIYDVLKMTIKGQTKMNLEITGSEEPLREIDKMVNKLVVGIVTAALLIGSSFIFSTDMKPQILGIPVLGGLGYFFALLLSVWLLHGIIIKSKR